MNIFKKNGKLIEYGSYIKCDDGTRFFSTLLIIDPIKKEVMTNCGDFYYDYSLDFNEILTIANKIKELTKENNKNEWN